MSFCSLIKGITPKICMFCPNKQQSSGPFMCLELCWLDLRMCLRIRRVLKCASAYDTVWSSWGDPVQLRSSYFFFFLFFLNNIKIQQQHSYQPLLEVNLSPEFVNLYFPYAGQSFVFSLVAVAFLIPTDTCGSGRKKQCCVKYACTTSNLTSNKTS